jgi:hypothetical protein
MFLSHTPTDPTPAQIECACRLIRSSWSPVERRLRRIAYADTARRAKSNPAADYWTPPVISITAEVAEALEVE